MTADFNGARPVVFAAGSLVGRPVRRVEDPALLTGQGSYIDNLQIDGVLHLVFVRSAVAHAAIGGVDVSTARGMPGVVAVYTATEMGLPPYPFMGIQLHPAVCRPVLATDEVQFVGDSVAVVVAQTRAQGVDAADVVEVDYDPLPVVVDMEAALSAESPMLFADVESNLIYGNRSPVEGALDGADLVVRGRFENQRMAPVPMEGAAVAVLPGGERSDTCLTLYLACQAPHMMREVLAKQIGMDPRCIRIITPDVGGSFGSKHLSVETLAAVKIARDLNRPVKWVEYRSENMVALPHSRGQVQYIELGLTRDGKFVGMRCRMVSDSGAYGSFGGSLVLGTTRAMAQGTYVIPKISYDVAIATTNTTPMGGYRGAGRPEASAFLERIIDMAADDLGLDPAELRRRNFIPPGAFPYKTAMGTVYDSGNYQRALDEALCLAKHEDLLAEQTARRVRGDDVLLGIGMSCYVEISAGQARRPSEYAAIEVHEDGTATLRSGTSAHGQGLATAFSQIAAGVLGIPIERIRFVASDTDLVPRGGGTGGSRSMQVGGSAVFETAMILLDRGKELAGDLLEAAPDDIVVIPGRGLAVAGVPSKVLDWQELAAAARDRHAELAVEHDTTIAGPSFPFGAHVSVVEVDVSTGRVVPVRHIAVDDCGRIINPMLVAGQIHGGLAAGISQALWEQIVYDPDGNPLTATLVDYAVPSASELPSFEVGHTETLSPNNVLGAKGVGESATVGATPAVQNAVVDALSHLGIRHIDLPCTPERVWRALQDAKAGRSADPWREPPGIFGTLPVRDAGEDLDIRL